ncbi:MAG: phage/plasmid primase, P4 family, partial [Myxococcota bacterium]
GKAVAALRDLGVPKERIRRFDMPPGCDDLNDCLINGAVSPGMLSAAPTLAQLDQATIAAFTDVGNAARFARLHSENLRYVPELEQWLRWNDRNWRRAHDEIEPMQAAVAVTAEMMREGLAQDSEDLQEHALKSQQINRLTAMIKIAKSRPGVAIAQAALDRDPYLLTVENGTLNLRTGELGEHRRNDLITTRIAIEYDPGARSPNWDRFIAEVFEPNPDGAEFLRRYAGYSLTGDISAQCLMFAHGSGSNGKGVVFQTFQRMLGERLSVTVPFETFVASRFHDVPGHTLASMYGKRVVLAPEGKKGVRLAEAMIKQLTGGDTISACPKYKPPFNYIPTFKLWMSSNHKPEIRGTDEGIWRRIRVLPFLVNFEHKRDDYLTDALASELPGILAWAVRGCLDWLADGGGIKGLGDAQSVTAATEEYRQDSDILGRFIAECCITDIKDAQARTTAVYAAYQRWAERDGIRRPLSAAQFGQELKRRGFAMRRRNRGNAYPLGLRAEYDDAEPDVH